VNNLTKHKITVVTNFFLLMMMVMIDREY